MSILSFQRTLFFASDVFVISLCRVEKHYYCKTNFLGAVFDAESEFDVRFDVRRHLTQFFDVWNFWRQNFFSKLNFYALKSVKYNKINVHMSSMCRIPAPTRNFGKKFWRQKFLTSESCVRWRRTSKRTSNSDSASKTGPRTSFWGIWDKKIFFLENLTKIVDLNYISTPRL